MTPRVRLFICTVLAAMAVHAIGCSSSAPTAVVSATAMVTPPEAGTDDAGTPEGPDGSANASASAGASTDAGVILPLPPSERPQTGQSQAGQPQTEQPQTEGSPLCNASSWMGCYPDNTKTGKASDCNPSPDVRDDAGISGYDNSQSACHVQRASNDAGVQPVCTASGSNTDGMACGGPTDCAPGYECIGVGKCQPYCCKGTCSQPEQFCDIQPTATDPGLKVPVCMPIQSCGLLDSAGAACPPTDTCAVVRSDTGATGCVAVGPKQAGENCNTADCARGLTCLGAPAEKTCYILCHTGERTTECASTPKQTCKGGLPLFPIPGIGICE
jgi:hypothetical protein